MNADTPQNLLMFLLATSLLGGVMGYCLALILAKRRASAVIDSMRARLTASKSAVESDLKSARSSIDELHQNLEEEADRASAALKREEALEVHSQLQAQRIQSLESQVSSYEDQQIRLQRDFASYKSNKSRELEIARNSADSWSQTDQLPVLNKRIDDNVELESEFSEQPAYSPVLPEGQSKVLRGSRASRERGGLSIPLSRELDIPSLAESELPDSVDDLEFEMTELDTTGGWPRG